MPEILIPSYHHRRNRRKPRENRKVPLSKNRPFNFLIVGNPLSAGWIRFHLQGMRNIGTILILPLRIKAYTNPRRKGYVTAQLNDRRGMMSCIKMNDIRVVLDLENAVPATLPLHRWGALTGIALTPTPDTFIIAALEHVLEHVQDMLRDEEGDQHLHS